MKVTILCAGKIKENYLAEGIAEYKKRISRYAELSIEQVQDEKTPDKASEKTEEIIKRMEGQRMLGCLKRLKGDNSYVMALAIDGKAYDSEEFSKKISDLTTEGKSHIIFIIGGSLGLSDEVLKESDLKLSFGRLTFPHQLMRLILVEQIYRAFKIKTGEPYHK